MQKQPIACKCGAVCNTASLNCVRERMPTTSARCRASASASPSSAPGNSSTRANPACFRVVTAFWWTPSSSRKRVSWCGMVCIRFLMKLGADYRPSLPPVQRQTRSRPLEQLSGTLQNHPAAAEIASGEILAANPHIKAAIAMPVHGAAVIAVNLQQQQPVCCTRREAFFQL